ncbi:MAG: MmcQ/YjbR family DNA-binding protein [Nitriliruptorales bacterium]
MDLKGLRAFCLAKAGAAEEYPFGPGALVMKVGGRIFAIIGEDDDPHTVSLKCEPGLAVILRGSYDAVSPGYHLDKRHWNTVTLDGSVSDREIRDWVDDSYDLVVDGLARKVRDRLRAAGG